MSNKSHRWKSLLTFLTLLALVATVYLLRGQLAQTLRDLRDANPWPILLVLPLTILNHYFHGKLYQALFKIFGTVLPIKAMMRLSLELNLVNNVFPSGGVSGFSYLSIRMKRQGVTTGKATFVQMMRFTTLFVSFQVLLAVGLVMLAFSGRANNFVMLVAGSLITLLVLGTGGIAYMIGSQKRIQAFSGWLAKVLNRLIQVVRPKHPETINLQKLHYALTELHESYRLIRSDIGQLRRPLLFALLVSLTEVASIFAVFVAFGHVVNPGAIIIAYAVANFAGIVSVLPGGVGIYEGLMTGVFAAAGVAAAVSLPVIVAYRVVSMAIQLPAGYYYYQRALRTKTPPA